MTEIAVICEWFRERERKRVAVYLGGDVSYAWDVTQLWVLIISLCQNVWLEFSPFLKRANLMNVPVLVMLHAQFDSLLDCDSESLSNAVNKWLRSASGGKKKSMRHFRQYLIEKHASVHIAIRDILLPGDMLVRPVLNISCKKSNNQYTCIFPINNTFEINKNIFRSRFWTVLKLISNCAQIQIL